MNDRDVSHPRVPSPADASSAPADYETAVASGGTAGRALGSPDDPERASADTDTLTQGAAAAGVASQGGDLPNTTTNPRQGAAPAWTAEDVRLREFARIEPGWTVVGADGEQLGAVVEKGPGWFSLHYGVSDERTMYLPQEYIETVANNRVVLNQPAPLLIDMKLDAPPPDNPSFEHERLSGTDHDPRRGDTGERLVIPAPVDMPAQSPMPPAGGLRGDAGTAADRQLSGRPDVQSAAGGLSPVTTPGHTARARIEGAAAIADVRAARSDSAEPAAAAHTARGEAVQPRAEQTVQGEVVSRAETDPTLRAGYSTHMEAPVTGEHADAFDRVNKQETVGQTFEERSGYDVFAGEQRLDREDGPTHQPGVRDPNSLEPLRTQLGRRGTPGEGKERNITETDLTRNQHPDGHPFDSQESTVGRPLAPGEPSAARRSMQDTARLPVPPEDRPRDVPPGAVSRPLPDQ